MSKIIKTLEEQYQDYQAQQQEAEIERLTSYQALKEWLKAEKVRDPLTMRRRAKFLQLGKILDLCAELVTADTRDREDIVSQIEEELR